GCHWTVLKDAFHEWCARHPEVEPIVFEGVDWLALWALFVGRRFDRLAEMWRPVREEHQRYSHEERVRYLRERLELTAPAPAPALSADQPC
ncbi:MAG TPA: hypothetical protein VFS00_24060, partial [Polyangiaceae bacterium]|nr:hypothetical protein [Polyangiaceae bacterium]